MHRLCNQAYGIDALQRQGLEAVGQAIFPLLDAPNQDLNIEFLTRMFEEPANVDCFLAGSNLFRNAGTVSQVPATTPELRQLSAKVGCSIDTQANH